MTYIYRLAGENLELAENELNGFLESQNKEEKASRKGRIAETEAHPQQLKRLALTHEVCRKISEASTVDELEVPEVEGNFAVRAEKIADREIKDIEEHLGEMINSEVNSVDLETPEKVFKAYILEDSLILGEVVEDINRGLFQKRSNEKRPFSSPVSMDPVLARVLINLSRTKPGEHLLDPFCGTGGILIEAGLCGIGVHGRDINKEMIDGTEENLEAYGIINHDIQQSEASKVDTDDYSAITTDLPYGKASKKTESAVEDFLEIIDDFEGRVVFMYNEPEIGGLKSEFEIYIHKNLTRHVFIV